MDGVYFKLQYLLVVTYCSSGRCVCVAKGGLPWICVTQKRLAFLVRTGVVRRNDERVTCRSWGPAHPASAAPVEVWRRTQALTNSWSKLWITLLDPNFLKLLCSCSGHLLQISFVINLQHSQSHTKDSEQGFQCAGTEGACFTWQLGMAFWYFHQCALFHRKWFQTSMAFCNNWIL